jgi:LAS superfamily LD-carboxypeptidase LdcB
MTSANAAIREGLLIVLEGPMESGDYTWLCIRDTRDGREGWIYEHLTSNEAIAIDSTKGLPIGQERVDRYSALPHDYRPGDLIPLDMKYCRIRQIELRREASEAFIELYNAAVREGIHLYGFSGYRPYETQRELYLNRIQRGEMHRQRYVARPGHTEHQLGTTLDVVGNDTNIAAQLAFDNTREAAWLRTECYQYGFILSYGTDNTVPTGYGYESWHIRYVGKTNAIEWIRTHIAPENPVYKKYIIAK